MEVKNLFARFFDISKISNPQSWKWDHLDFRKADQFVWKEGETPLSSLQIIIITWLIYFGGIILIQNFMKYRPKGFSLRYTAAVHNLILCLWSLIMFLGVSWEIFLLWQNGGFNKVYCDSTSISKGRLYYWIYIYYLSKFYELFDTAIIVLKKVFS